MTMTGMTGMEFSFFYFADTRSAPRDRYRLLIEGARFADEHGFAAVWTPERHFHVFGGQYPNPAVTGAAVAAVTERVAVRAGSVVAPLHHPMRIAEEWSVVDNLSGGRAGVAFASGWHVSDFALRPETYPDRKRVVAETVETVRRLWRQEELPWTDGNGGPVSLRIYPPPVQPELPMWLTSAGSPDTFRTAGELGTGVLTHLLGQDLPALGERIAVYRRALAEHHPGRPGHVALMLHTFLGEDRDAVRELVREPFSAYIRSSIGLLARADNTVKRVPAGMTPSKVAGYVDALVARSFDRYFDNSGLFGTLDDGVRVAGELAAIGVDEIACLIDFGVAPEVVLAGLDRLDELRRVTAGPVAVP
jgi:natural product biosynthesis luciferase-like monooxygenase protein